MQSSAGGSFVRIEHSPDALQSECAQTGRSAHSVASRLAQGGDGALLGGSILLSLYDIPCKVHNERVTDLQLIGAYVDLYYPARTHAQAAQLRQVYCMHALNHVLANRHIGTAGDFCKLLEEQSPLVIHAIYLQIFV